MKFQILFSGKNKKNISICCLLKILPRVLSLRSDTGIIAPDKRGYPRNIFLISSQKHVGTHQKCLAEALLISTHNICFCEEIRKMSVPFG